MFLSLAVFIICIAPTGDPFTDLENGTRAAAVGEYVIADLLLNRALNDNPGFDRLTLGTTYFTLGQVRFHLGRHAEALINFRLAQKSLPAGAHYPVLVFAGRAHLARNEREEAFAKLDAAVRLDPKKPDAYLHRGHAHSGDDAAGHLDRAVADYGQAVKLSAGNAEVEGLSVVARGRVYDIKGDYKRALADYERAVELRPEWAEGHRILAWFRATCPVAEFRDRCEAVRHAQKARQLTKWTDPNDYDVLAAAWAEAEDFEQACEFQEKALKSPEYPQGKRAAGKARLELYKKGKPYREPTR